MNECERVWGGGLKALQYFWLFAAMSGRRVETVLADGYELQSSVLCNYLLLLLIYSVQKFSQGHRFTTAQRPTCISEIQTFHQHEFINTGSSPRENSSQAETAHAFCAHCTCVACFQNMHPYQKCGHMRYWTPQDEHTTAPIKPPVVRTGCKAEKLYLCSCFKPWCLTAGHSSRVV